MMKSESVIAYRCCPQCGAANIGHMQNCLLCHSILPPSADQARKARRTSRKSDQSHPRFCTRCGKALPVEHATRFCRYCGQPIIRPGKAEG
jgi:predicted RNA-binding Zn-ribbon protein involved in translation (DUF1610 family)